MQRNGAVVIAARPQSRMTDTNCGRRGRRLGARASRPPARRTRAYPEYQDAQPPPSPRVGALRGDRNRGRPKWISVYAGAAWERGRLARLRAGGARTQGISTYSGRRESLTGI